MIAEDNIIQFINNVGFPIVAFLLIYLDLRRLINKQHETLNRLLNKLDKKWCEK